jgi:acyl-CoA reductase-like NAD-dependent aldehyde dehydrogenase
MLEIYTTNRNGAVPIHSFAMTIGGKAIVGAATYTVINPANGQVIASVPDCSRDELEQAVTAARADFPEWAAELTVYARGVVVGDPLTGGVQFGPVSNRRQYDAVVGLIRDARDKGYTFLTGGLPDQSAAGFFVAPTLIDNPPEDARIVQEEQFGPVLPLLKFSDIDDVVARANATEYGLSASVWSADIDAAHSIAQRLQAGTVWVNEVQHLSPAVAFGGLKQSGLGTESGLAGLIEFTDAQTLTIKRK